MAFVTFDASLCLICQKGGNLVLNPKKHSFEKLVSRVNELAQCGDNDCILLTHMLKDFDAEALQKKCVSWHRECYQGITHPKKLKILQSSFHRKGDQDNVWESTNSSSISRNVEGKELQKPFTRSSGEKLDKTKCFFCGEGGDLHEVRNVKAPVGGMSVGQRFYDAVMNSNNEKWIVKIQSISQNDLLSIDIKYRTNCYVKNVQRQKGASESKVHTSQSPNKTAGEVEFFNMFRNLIKRDGACYSMDELQNSYKNILEDHDVQKPDISRRHLKRKLQTNADDIQFIHPSYKQPEMVSSSSYFQKCAGKVKNEVLDMEAIYQCAKTLRQDIFEARKTSWKFNGSLVDCQEEENVPASVYTFFRWVIQGPQTEILHERRSESVKKAALRISQLLLYEVKSERQVKYSPITEACTFRNSKHNENHQVVAVGLKVHAYCRSKKLVNYLYECGLSIDYNRILRLETQLAESVIQRMQMTGVYIPAGIKCKAPIYFAVDNVDFSEDTVDGKGTTHSTVLVLFQPASDIMEDITQPLRLSSSSSGRSLKSPPSDFTCKTVKTVKPKRSEKFIEH